MEGRERGGERERERGGGGGGGEDAQTGRAKSIILVPKSRLVTNYKLVTQTFHFINISNVQF